MEKEIWMDIKGYEGLYMVSSLGAVRSLINRHRIARDKSLIRFLMPDGYLKVNLFNKGKSKQYMAHRLVAQAFILNPGNKPHINHKNGIKSDNNVQNLEWCTPSENMQHADRTGLRKLKKGKEHHSYGVVGKDHHSSVPVTQYTLNGKFVACYDGMSDAYRQTGVNSTAISSVCTGKRKSAGGFLWSYTIKFKKTA